MIKLLSLIFIFIAWRILNFFLSKKEKERTDRFGKYASDIESKVNSIRNNELAQLRKEIKEIPSSYSHKNISELLEIDSTFRYSKRKIRRFFNPYTGCIEEFPESKITYIAQSSTNVHISSFDLENLIKTKVEKQKFTGKVVPLRKEVI